MKRVIDAVYQEHKNNDDSTRLAYCIPSLDHSGGMERVLTAKANYLADELGYEVNIIITDDKGQKPYFQLSPKVNVIQLDINIDSLWQYPIWKRLYLYHQKMDVFKLRLSMCLQRLQPDITISLLRREINFLCDIKDGSAKVGEIHFGRYKYREANFIFLPDFINRFITRRWMAQLDKKVSQLDRFVVLTHEDAAMWHKQDNLQVIPNPITIMNGPSANYDQKQVIAVGRYTYQKGFDLLIRAWKKVFAMHPDWQLNIYGDGNREQYQAQAEALGLQDAVMCYGPVSNIREKYAESAIFVLSSRFEGLPLVLMEAMATGLPPVAFACQCGPKDIINNGIDGILCKAEDIDELANGINSLIDNEKTRKSMGTKASINIQRFSMVQIMHQWDVLFQELHKRHTNKA